MADLAVLSKTHHSSQYQAITCYQHALRIIEDLGDRYWEADTLDHLGDTHQAASQPDHARNNWQRALLILEDLKHPGAEQIRIKLQQP